MKAVKGKPDQRSHKDLPRIGRSKESDRLQDVKASHLILGKMASWDDIPGMLYVPATLKSAGHWTLNFTLYHTIKKFLAAKNKGNCCPQPEDGILDRCDVHANLMCNLTTSQRVGCFWGASVDLYALALSWKLGLGYLLIDFWQQ